MEKSAKKWIVSGLLLCLTLISFMIYHKATSRQKDEVMISQLMWDVNAIQTLAQIDQKRNENISRVMAVIDNYNDSMSEFDEYRVASEIISAAAKYDNLNIDLICAIITHESALTWEPTVVSPAGALGLMQVMPGTGRFLARVEGLNWTSSEDVLFDPVKNIRLGCRYLSSLIDLYDIDGGLAAYNGGGRRAEMWLAQNRASGILFEETQNYVPAVLTLYEQFVNN